MQLTKDQRGLVYYFLLTFAFSWLLWSPAVFASQGLFSNEPGSFLVKLGGFVPSIVAFYLTFLCDKTDGVIYLIKKALRYRFPSIWHLYIFSLLPTITFTSTILISWKEGIGFPSLLLPLLIPRPWLIAPLILFFVLAQGPLGEEFGWRGYALERLLLRHNPFISSMILGVIWTLWHLPLFFVEGTIQNTLAQQGMVVVFIGYLFYTVMLTILMTLLHIKTGGSLLSALLFHAMANFSHGLFTVITTPMGGVTVVTMMLAVTTVTVITYRESLFNFDEME